ncbi:MAG: type I DNA topoisomerase [Planctomycetes bacterium]|nr:type I DNA topoisomerase [Planctomycetota bacterium]
MPKNLVIVESPAKARTINKYLGKDFVVKASMGHVRDLPKASLGIDVENGFAAKYLVIRSRSQIVKDLKASAKGAAAVYLAPDPDREGEAIAWHLIHALDLPEDRVFRITFNEITQRAVRAAMQRPGKVNENLVNAQQARRILDRLVGYKLSPLLWEKIARGLSAGRVQSVAVRLVVEREREIRAFRQEEYWKVTATLCKQGAIGAGEMPAPDHPALFRAELKRQDGKPLELADEAAAQTVLAALAGQTFRVAEVERKQKSLKAPPPLTTSLLQQQASTRLRFSAKKTMRVAQQLYEGIDIGGEEGQVGLITYMRTDSFRLAGEALQEARGYIAEKFGERYLPEKPNFFAARKGAQEAHEAIRPTSILRAPDDLRPHLQNDQYRLYRLIWQRVVASQMANAVFDQTAVAIEAGPYTFTCRGRAVVFDGHLRVGGMEKEASGPDAAEQGLPPLATGEPLDPHGIEKTQHFTQPPARYTEATLVRSLEKNGIGRPSTYATILSTIQDRGYVRLEERKFHATDLGEVVNESLVTHFPDIFDYEFTAGMESKLDRIEEEKADWLSVVREFYEVFVKDLDRAAQGMANIKAQPAPGGETCPLCGSPLLLRFNRYGRFLGCSAYPKCKHVQRVAGDGAVLAAKPAPEPTDEKCDKCGAPMVIRVGKRGRFMACSAWPACRNTCSVGEDGKPIRPIVSEVPCDQCGALMVVRFSRRGPFLGCASYPKCRGTKPLPPELKERVKEARKQGRASARSMPETEPAVDDT